jgi:hypothetical protein
MHRLSRPQLFVRVLEGSHVVGREADAGEGFRVVEQQQPAFGLADQIDRDFGDVPAITHRAHQRRTVGR